MSKNKKQSFLFGSTVLMISTLIVKIVGAIFKVPLSGMLDEHGMGYFNSAYTIYNAVYALFVTGLSAAVARMVAENSTRGRYNDVRKLLKIATKLFIFVGVLGTLIIALSANHFTQNVIDSPNSYLSVLMISPAIFFCCLMAAYRGYYEGLNDMIPTAITQVVEILIKLVSGLAFTYLVLNIANKQYEDTQTVFGIEVASAELVHDVTIPYAAAGAVLGVTFSTLAGFLYIYTRYNLKGDHIKRKLLLESPPPMRTVVLVVRLVKISLPITLGAVVIQLSALIDMVTIMDRLSNFPEGTLDMRYAEYLTATSSAHEFLYGCFTLVLVPFNLVPACTNIFGKSALPNITAAWTNRERAKIKTSIESVIRITALVASPMAFGVSFMAQPILSLLYPSLPGTIAIGTPILNILGVASLFLAMVTPINAIFQGIGLMNLPVKFLLVGATIKFLCNYFLIGIEQINILGGAISTLACYGTIAFISLTTLNKKTNIMLNYTNILIKPAISGVICGFSAYFCNFVLTKLFNHSIITIVSIFVGAIGYVFALGAFKVINRDDILILPKGKKIVKILEILKIIR